MRGMALWVSVAFLAFSAPASAGHYNPTSGQFVGKVAPQVQALLNAYGRTQDAGALQAAIATLVAKHPELADDAVFASQSLSSDEQAAIANGLGQAYANLAAIDPKQAGIVKTAIGFAPNSFQTAYNTEVNSLTGLASTSGGGGSNGGGTGGGGGGGLGVGSYSAPSAGGGGSGSASPS